MLRENRSGRTDAELEELFRPPHPARKGREIPIATLYTRLGLTPYDRKASFTRFDWQPASVTIPLDSHIGQPAGPTVGTGDRVKRGDVIGTVDQRAMGCPVHASIGGRITAVNQKSIEITA